MKRLTKDMLPSLLTGMVFGSHSQRAFGGIIAWATMNGKPNESVETHTGFIFIVDNEVMVTEVQGKGFKLDSIEKYFTKHEYIVSVFEPLTTPSQQTALVAAIARALRKDYDAKYDLAGAIASAPFAKKILWFIAPWLKQNPKRQFCSEKVACILSSVGMPVISMEPNPRELAQYMAIKGDAYRRIV